MDTSEKYILMCERAREIQKGWIPHTGDWFLDKSTLPLEIEVFGGWYVLREDGFIERVGESDNYDFEDKGNVEVWLPRQDDLQGMIADKWHYDGFRWMVKDFVKWIDWHSKDTDQANNSMEQLWLAFVMKELYKKEWENGDWVKKQ